MAPIRGLIVFSLLLAPLAHAQLTREQKVVDFMQLAGLYAKHYAPYEWKRDVIGFDLLNVKPWLAQVEQSRDDIEFYDICTKYVAALEDSHDEFILPSSFLADLPFAVDIYDGKVLVDGISRTLLPLATYPIRIGDELVSVDGRPVEDLIKEYIPYSANGSANPSSRRRLAADTITSRFQGFFPRAHLIGEKAAVVIRHQSGETATYEIAWVKTGAPLTGAGQVPSPRTARVSAEDRVVEVSRKRLRRDQLKDEEDIPSNPWEVWQGEPADRVEEATPAYLRPLRELQFAGAMASPAEFAGFGLRNPVFSPPAGFRQRLGALQNDAFVSGTYVAGDKTIGFIRIPTMSPANQTLALNQFLTEMIFFQQNTDALVIDVMRNGGGSLCYVEVLGQLLIPRKFRSIAYEIRATNFWVQVFSSSYEQAKAANAGWIADLYGNYLAQIQTALRENRGRTGDIPICAPNFLDVEPRRTGDGTFIGYSKPVLVLVDEFSLSAAEAFAALLQDHDRGVIFGVRTDGGGGNPATYTATTYSEASTRVTRTFVTRAKAVETPGFPKTAYIENVGVYPDILNDYMTKENLLGGGQTYVTAFTNAVLGLVGK